MTTSPHLVTMNHSYRRFWKVLEPNQSSTGQSDEHSYIHIFFKELHYEKKTLEYSAHKIYLRFTNFIEQL